MVTFWPRLNTVLLLITLLAVIGVFATRAFGGPLDPPGPPASTPGGIDGRIPIDHLPFTTTDAGTSYVVTRNLSAGAGQSGITICCSNTTIDLGGFTLFGAGAGMSPGDGIYNPGARNVVVKNGAVRGWSFGINLGGTYSRIEGVHATANLEYGIYAGPESEVTDCNASLNAFYGVYANHAAVRNRTMAENGEGGIQLNGNNSLVEDNHININSSESAVGIAVQAGDYNTIRNNDISGSSAQGDINIDPSSDGTVLQGNTYCTLVNSGTNTVLTGNVDRVSAC